MQASCWCTLSVNTQITLYTQQTGQVEHTIFLLSLSFAIALSFHIVVEQ